MALSESQLSTWSNQGAMESSAATYASIKKALENHRWPIGMRYEVYLQGSYPNATNIRGNSDVDVVVELTSAFYTDLPRDQWDRYSISPGAHGYTDLRREVISALQQYYGTSLVDTTGPNAISVAASNGRLKADILPCVTYREYNGGGTYVEGIKFWNQQTGEEKINYPKVHIDNGSAKNSPSGTQGRYKPSVRMFKNARERIIGNSDELRKRYPSYFIECLFYNVPNAKFGSSCCDTYVNAVNFLSTSLANGSGQQFTTQNSQQVLFGPASTQWSLTSAQQFVSALAALWNNS
jgi:hypothetical protein